MNAILLIARRELAGYFRTWLGYIIIAAVLVLDGLLFNAFALGSGMDKKSSEVISQFFFFSSGVTMTASVFISMRLLAAERESGTVNLLYSSPVRDFEIVVGKYLAALGFLAILLGASVYMPMMVLVAGKISFGHVLAGYLGLLLLGAASLAIGTFGSAVSRSQILAVILSAVMVVALLVMWWVGRVTDRPLSNVFENLALWSLHFPPFQSGIIHLRDVIYYVAISYVALFASVRVLEAREVALMNAPSYVWTLVYFGGMLLAFVGERIVGAGTARALTGVGVPMIGAAIAVRAARGARASAYCRQAERMLIALYAVGAFAVALYLAQSDLSSSVLGKPLERDWPKLQTTLAALWPVLWVFSAFPIIMGEFSYATVARSPRLEIARIRDAVWSGVGLAGAIVFAFALCYVGAERDKKVDLSYFRTAKPGESTRKIVRTMDQPIQVSLFFPPANEVREEVAGYFDDLKKESKLLEVQSFDRDVDPQKAKELGVTGNGIVVVARGGHREQMSIGLELEGARAQLRNLDRDVQTRLLKVARPARNVYFVTGHGERTFDPVGDTDKRATVRDMREVLTQQGYTVRQLGAAEGLAQEVPQDAALVIVVGPTKPFQPEEAAALNRYFQKGGRLLVALDPESGDAHELLAPLGVKYVTTVLNNDVAIARKSNQISDRQNIVTATFSSHPSVTTLGRYGGRAPLIMIGAGHFEEQKDKPKENAIDVTVRAHPATWDDQNANFAFDAPAEKRKTYELAMAITKKGTDKDKKDEGRIILVGDSDFMSDGVIGAYGNPLFVLDGAKWLVGDEGITGEVTNENDVPIVHTKKQDQVWFYGSSFLAPALVLVIGFFVVGRRRGRAVRRVEKQS